MLVQSTRLAIDDPAFRAALEDVIRTVTPFKTITNLRSPLTAGHEGLVSRDGQTALVEWGDEGRREDREANIDAVTAATAAVAARHPSLYIGQAGSVSSSKALNEAFSKQLKQAGTRSVR